MQRERLHPLVIAGLAGLRQIKGGLAGVGLARGADVRHVGALQEIARAEGLPQPLVLAHEARRQGTGRRFMAQPEREPVMLAGRQFKRRGTDAGVLDVALRGVEGARQPQRAHALLLQYVGLQVRQGFVVPEPVGYRRAVGVLRQLVRRQAAR